MLFGLINTKNGKQDSPTVDCRGNTRFTSRANGGQKDLDRQLIELYEVSKVYRTAAGRFTALDNINLTIGEGEFVSIIGKSGSGKTTLINMLTGIDAPSDGQIYVADTPVHCLDEGQIANWRGETVGVVFQFFQLLPMLTVVENVMLPMDLCNMYNGRERLERAMGLLERVDLVSEADKLPSRLSGGQQQRAAIARALANDPPIIASDEPTGNLDSRTADAVIRMFEELVEQGKTILMVTHDNDLARRAQRTIRLADGKIIQD